MNRDFSILRRRANIIDLVTPIRPGVDGYRFDAASNFDQTYTTLFTTTVGGHIDPVLNTPANVTQPLTNKIRIIFDPSNYSLDDSKTFWMRFVPVTGGTPGTPGTGVMVLPDGGGRGMIILAGATPVGATITSSLTLGLPGLVEDLRIVNTDSTNPMFVASDESDAEYRLDPITSATPIVAFRGAISTLRVRSTSAAVQFSATCTLAFPR